MDQIKTGKLIAALRKEKGYTQEELGRILGVSNKTVSRWENGNYMPDIETLRLLGREFSVSIEELLDGERISAKEPTGTPDPFTPKERADFWRRNWKRENRSWFIFWGIVVFLFVLSGFLIAFFAARILGFGIGKLFSVFAVIFFAAGILSFCIYLYFYNKMCIYVDNNAYKISGD